MADNIELDSGSGGATLAAASLLISGDTSIVQMVGAGILSGSEGSWTHSQLVGGAGAVAAGVQRVTLASDDPAVAKLGTIDADTSAMAVDLAAIETLLTAANVDHAANEALLTTIDADTGAIKTAVEIIDNAVSGSEMQVDIVADGAGLATDAKLDDIIADTAAMETLLGTIDTDTGAMVTDLAAIETLLTAANVDHAANEALLTTIDADTGAMATDLAAIETLLTAANVDHAANEVLLGTIDSDTDAIKTAAETVAAAVSTEMQVDVVAALPAGTNTVGGTIAQQSTSVAYDGTTACTIKRATGVAATGTVNMVAAVGGYQIRVLALAVFATSATGNTIRIHNDDNDLIGNAGNAIPIAVDADGDNSAGFVLPWNPGGWFQTDTDNQALDITLSAAQDVIYAVTYIEVT